MQGLCKFDFQINFILNGILKYMSFSLDKNLVFIDTHQFISSSLDSLVKKLVENDFMNSSQEFNGEVLDLVKQKGFNKFDFEKFMKGLPGKRQFKFSLDCKGISGKE